MALERHKYLHRKSLRNILSNHDRYILLSPPNEKELKYFVGGFMQYKVMPIPNSIPEVQAKPGIKEKIILHVGRLNDDQKRSDLLLPFWSACKDRLPEWKFVVVGDGPYMAEMKDQIRNQNIERVTLTGFQKPEVYFKKASIFMMPSAYEGFPNTILEAQSYGCPVLAYKSYDALDWIVNDGEDAFLMEPFDVQKMADAAVDLAKDEKNLKLAQNAALKNAGRFTIDKVGKIWEELFEKLSEKKLNGQILSE
jgi:glycosyltransferase involved in cell wall biosynthesis